jgi:hypothetical protein
MTREEVQNLLDLARRLGSTPRQLLVRAACMACVEDADANAGLRRLRETGLQHRPLANDCADLLLTPVASFAKENLGPALDQLWHDAAQVDR